MGCADATAGTDGKERLTHTQGTEQPKPATLGSLYRPSVWLCGQTAAVYLWVLAGIYPWNGAWLSLSVYSCPWQCRSLLQELMTSVSPTWVAVAAHVHHQAGTGSVGSPSPPWDLFQRGNSLSWKGKSLDFGPASRCSISRCLKMGACPVTQAHFPVFSC